MAARKGGKRKPVGDASAPPQAPTEAWQDDFKVFLRLMWAFLGLPEPTPIQYDLADYLQYGPRRRMVQAFRGVGKSWITAAFVLWRLLKNRNERILVTSASKDRADAFSVFVKRCISEWDLLAPLMPEEGMRDSNLAFDVGGSEAHQAPSVRSVGITGQLTGGRATIIVADDVETPKNSLTTVMREKLSEAVKEFDAVLVPNGEIVYLGTPQTEMSVYSKLPERGYEIRVWPARYENHEFLAPSLRAKLEANPKLRESAQGRGEPTDPLRFSDLDLLEREASYGRSGFALQFQLNTSLADQNRYPLKLADAMVMTLTPDMAPIKVVWGSHPDNLHSTLPVVGLTGDRWYRPMFIAKEFTEYQGCVMCIDPSGRGSDETGYAVVAMCNGFLYVLEAGGLVGGYDDSVLSTLALIAKRNRVTFIRIEPNFGDGMFDKLFAPHLQRIYPCTIDPDPPRSSIQKEKRIIDTLEPILNQHRLIFNEKIVLDDVRTDGSHGKAEDVKYQLFYQMTRITRDKGAISKDDRLDALAMAVAYWREVMDRNVDTVVEDHRQAALEKELEDFMGHVLGGRPAGSNAFRPILGGLVGRR